MIRKGQVSSIDTNKCTARVTFRDMDNVVTADIPYAKNVTININDFVAVVFFSANMSDGLIISAFS